MESWRGRFCRVGSLSALLAVALFGASIAEPQPLRPGAPAQGASAAPGFRIFGTQSFAEVFMADSNRVVNQTWVSTIEDGFATYADRNGALLRVVVTDPLPVGGTAGGVQRIALDGTILWDYRYDEGGVLSHHDIAELPNGNVLLIAWEEKTRDEALAAGRAPGLVEETFRPDHIIEVRQTGPTTGEIVWEWRVWDHLVQDFDPTRDNFGVVGDHPELVDVNFPIENPVEGDFNHSNGIAYDPVSDRIFLSANQQSEIWVIDHSTTTEEAAGHTGGRWGRGGDLLYRWGNPEAYRAGSEGDRVFKTQHSPRVVPEGYPGEGNLLVFLNHAPEQFDRSVIYELELPLDEQGAFVLDPSGVFGPDGPTWTYTADGFYSAITSSVERLPNGNTLIASGLQNRVFEVDPVGTTVWEYDLGFGTVFNAHYVERSLWADRQSLSVLEGGRLELDLIAGTDFAGMSYLLLASRSGTEPGVEVGDGFNLPLNADPLFTFAREQPNSAIFESTSGTLDELGRAGAAFNLPLDSPLAAGDTVHFAYLLSDPSTGEVVFTSGPASVDILK